MALKSHNQNLFQELRKIIISFTKAVTGEKATGLNFVVVYLFFALMGKRVSDSDTCFLPWSAERKSYLLTP